MLCDCLEGWDGVGDGRDLPEGEDMFLPMTNHVDVGQKPVQHCKAIILQLKVIFKKYINGLPWQSSG